MEQQSVISNLSKLFIVLGLTLSFDLENVNLVGVPVGVRVSRVSVFHVGLNSSELGGVGVEELDVHVQGRVDVVHGVYFALTVEGT